MEINAIYAIAGFEHLPSVAALISSFYLWCSLKKGAHTMNFDLTGLESYVTDKKLETEEGVWVQFPNGHQFRILRAGPSNAAFGRMFQQLIRPYRRQMDKNMLDPEIGDDILRRVYSETIVKDWEGFYDENKEPVPYSPAAAQALFKQLPELFADIQTLSGEYATFQKAELEEAKDTLGEA